MQGLKSIFILQTVAWIASYRQGILHLLQSTKNAWNLDTSTQTGENAPRQVASAQESRTSEEEHQGFENKLVLFTENCTC